MSTNQFSPNYGNQYWKRLCSHWNNLTTFERAIGKVAWNNICVYRLNKEDCEDFRSEMKLGAVYWYRKHYPKFAELPERNITNLLMNHLTHRSQSYMDIKVRRHWL